MKRNFSKKSKTLVFIILGVVCVLILFILFYDSSSSTYFEMKYDSDKKSYRSAEYGYNCNHKFITYNSYLSYSGGELLVKDYSKTRITHFSQEGRTVTLVPKDAYILDDKMYYLSVGNLYCKQLEDDTEIQIDNNCKTFCVRENYIVYERDNSIIFTSTNNFDNKSEIAVIDDEVYYYDIEDNILYLIERNLEEYIFVSYNLDTLNEINRFSFGMKSGLDCLCQSNGNIYFYYGETGGIFCVNMETGDCGSIIYHPCVKDMVVNDDKIYFISERIEGEIIIKTAPDKNNGIWELDVSTAEIKKISEECDSLYLLATDNYVYCYKRDYVLPRGMANGWVKGYEITQIPIN